MNILYCKSLCGGTKSSIIVLNCITHFLSISWIKIMNNSYSNGTQKEPPS